MKLWHDDLRFPPDGWEWARTNDAARKLLTDYNVTVISLDYDMGLHEVDPAVLVDDPSYTTRGLAEDNGMRLVEWMVEHDRVPPEVYIHSWNTSGARSMYLYLNEHGHDCTYEAYSP